MILKVRFKESALLGLTILFWFMPSALHGEELAKDHLIQNTINTVNDAPKSISTAVTAPACPTFPPIQQPIVRVLASSSFNTIRDGLCFMNVGSDLADAVDGGADRLLTAIAKENGACTGMSIMVDAFLSNADFSRGQALQNTNTPQSQPDADDLRLRVDATLAFSSNNCTTRVRFPGDFDGLRKLCDYNPTISNHLKSKAVQLNATNALGNKIAGPVIDRWLGNKDNKPNPQELFRQIQIIKSELKKGKRPLLLFQDTDQGLPHTVMIRSLQVVSYPHSSIRHYEIVTYDSNITPPASIDRSFSTFLEIPFDPETGIPTNDATYFQRSDFGPPLSRIFTVPRSISMGPIAVPKDKGTNQKRCCQLVREYSPILTKKDLSSCQGQSQ
jgi:hypothetical protein